MYSIEFTIALTCFLFLVAPVSKYSDSAPGLIDPTTRFSFELRRMMIYQLINILFYYLLYPFDSILIFLWHRINFPQQCLGFFISIEMSLFRETAL